MTYEDFFAPEDIAVFKRVKLGQMNLARIMRETAHAMVGGELLGGGRKGKEFLRTEHGLYRLSIGDNADNTTEQAAHERMGAKPIVMGDEKQMGEFFVLHGHFSRIGAYADFVARIRARLASAE